MMKKILLYLSLAGAIFIQSCKRDLDAKSDFALDGTKPLSTLAEAETAITGVYSSFRGAGYFNNLGNTSIGGFSSLPDIMSDDLVEHIESFGNQSSASNWTYVSTDLGVTTVYANLYRTISGANIILRDIDRIPPTDPGKLKAIKAQALAIRAMAHFDALRFFATDFDRNSSSLGVAYVKTFDITAFPARLTVKETYDNIFQDLNEAIDTYNAGSSMTDVRRITLDGVYAIRARVNLYAKQWQDAVNDATFLIDRYPLADMDEFPLIWSDESNTEVIWKVAMDSRNDGAPYDNVFFTVNNRVNYRPTVQLANLYDADDVRGDTYISTVSVFNGLAAPGSPRLAVIKHRGKSLDLENGDGAVDWKVFRVAEMYLIRAEANYELGNTVAAQNDIEAIRDHRIVNAPAVTETGLALLDVIKTERRKELAFEGHRFFDLKRWDRTPIDRCGEVNTAPNVICSLAHDDRAWALPIPEAEIGANPEAEQNPGY